MFPILFLLSLLSIRAACLPVTSLEALFKALNGNQDENLALSYPLVPRTELLMKQEGTEKKKKNWIIPIFKSKFEYIQ